LCSDAEAVSLTSFFEQSSRRFSSLLGILEISRGKPSLLKIEVASSTVSSMFSSQVALKWARSRLSQGSKCRVLHHFLDAAWTRSRAKRPRSGLEDRFLCDFEPSGVEVVSKALKLRVHRAKRFQVLPSVLFFRRCGLVAAKSSQVASKRLRSCLEVGSQLPFRAKWPRSAFKGASSTAPSALGAALLCFLGAH
jgi:hypothetical protein